MPKVSVIVPVYKVERYVERCVRSLMEQTLDDMEFIFVDDCSPDGSMAIIERTVDEYHVREGQVRILHNKNNQGVTLTRLSGIHASTGEYLMFVDSDDWIDTTMAETLLNEAITNDADIARCGFTMVYHDNAETYFKGNQGDSKTDEVRSFINDTWSVLCNMIIKRKLFETLFESREYCEEQVRALSLTFCEDFHLAMLLIAYTNRIYNVDKPLYFYNRANENSLCKNMTDSQFASEQRSYLDIILFYKEKGIYEDYARELSGRVLRAHQGLILGHQFAEFRKVHPDKRKYVFGCRWINKKMQIMMWSVTHHCSFIASSILLLREIKTKLNKDAP